MKHFSRRSPDDGKSWAFIVYANVLVQMTEDLDSPGPDQAVAIRWFTEELEEVALVCAACSMPANKVYREVRRRLRVAKIKSARVSCVRWHLRHGDRLHEIRLLSG